MLLLLFLYVGEMWFGVAARPSVFSQISRCVGTIIAEALNATFSGRAPTPAPALQLSPQWTSADAEVRDRMVRTCLINMPAYVVWLDPDGSLQGPIRVSADPSWPQGAPIVIPGTGGSTASTRYRAAWVYAETEQGAIIGGESNPQNTDKVFRFSEDQQRDYHLARSSRFAAVRLTDAQWLGESACDAVDARSHCSCRAPMGPLQRLCRALPTARLGS